MDSSTGLASGGNQLACAWRSTCRDLRKGVVVVEAEKHRFTTIVNYLGVDIDDGERVVVVGEPNAEVDDIRSQLVFDEKAPPRK